MDPAWIWLERPDPRHLAGSGCSGRISGQLAENWPRRPASSQLAGFQQLLPEYVYAKYKKKKKLYYFILILFYFVNKI
jgi:hypothetical protein